MVEEIMVWKFVCLPNSNQFAVEHIFDTLMNQLMSSTDQFQSIDVHEIFRDRRTKQPASSARTLRPTKINYRHD